MIGDQKYSGIKCHAWESDFNPSYSKLTSETVFFCVTQNSLGGIAIAYLKGVYREKFVAVQDDSWHVANEKHDHHHKEDYGAPLVLAVDRAAAVVDVVVVVVADAHSLGVGPRAAHRIIMQLLDSPGKI